MRYEQEFTGLICIHIREQLYREARWRFRRRIDSIGILIISGQLTLNASELDKYLNQDGHLIKTELNHALADALSSRILHETFCLDRGKIFQTLVRFVVESFH